MADRLKLTEMQRRCMRNISAGDWHSFDYGRYRVAMRALHHRAPHLLEYEARDGEEYFHVTDAGRAHLASSGKGRTFVMTAAIPSREELLALADDLTALFDRAIAQNKSALALTEHEFGVLHCAAGALRLAAKPADEGVRIPFDTKAKLGYVRLIWGVTADGRVDLIAIATTDEARDRYLEAGKQMGRYRAVKDEEAYVDHLFGGGLLKAINSSRKSLSTTVAPKLDPPDNSLTDPSTMEFPNE